MDQRIRDLASTTFCGERLSRRQIASIQETVRFFPQLSRAELGHTVCEQLGWQTPGGASRLQFALRVLEELERRSILRLPPKRHRGRGRQQPLPLDDRTLPRPELEVPLADLEPLRLQAVTARSETELWNHWVERYHPLGYRQPIGAHLRYYVRDGRGRELGCLLFDFATRRLPCRDRFIGWEGQAFRPRLHLVVRNARYLVFPWVRVPNLASRALGLAARQLPRDWAALHGYRPVLLETFVNPEQQRASCYRAANWQLAGRTAGDKGKTPKDVYLLPLHPRWREILLRKPPQAPPRAPPGPPQAADGFVRMWRSMLDGVVRTAAAHDRSWQRRRRSIDTLLVVLFVYRLVHSSKRQGYAPILAGLWEDCRRLGLDLPQPRPVAASSICAARAKVGCGVFRRIHRQVLRQAGPAARPPPWRGHCAYAVDGSKLNLPRELTKEGYRTPGPEAYYPQGLLSCLHSIAGRVPLDVELHAHADERAAARRHLGALAPGDLVVYDRGYYSAALLHAHARRGIAAVFRLKRNASGPIGEFVAGAESEGLVSVGPPPAAGGKQAQRPCPLRLLKYTAGGTVFTLGTTLLDMRRYPAADMAVLYHGRWDVEEGCKVSKRLLQIERFHGRSEETVKQELYANFTLAALARLCASECEQQLAARGAAPERPPLRANFNHSLAAVGRELEGLLLSHDALLHETLDRVLEHVSRSPQRERPGRSYPRRSRRPVSKWRDRKPADSDTAG